VEGLSFRRLLTDAAVYTRGVGDEYLVIGVYVDDLIIMGASLNLVEEVKAQFSAEFEMTDLGEVDRVLGIKIERDRSNGWLKMHQLKFAEDVLKRFNMQNCFGVANPTVVGEVMTKEDGPETPEEDENMKNVPYREAIGSLMYLMVCTRPDLALSIGVASRFMVSPRRRHWEFVKRILRYVQKTKSFGLKFVKGSGLKVEGYCDSDWGGDIDTRKSTTGYVFLMGGAAISWSSKRQKIVALSSTEAEYIAAAQAAKEVLWINQFLEELNVWEGAIKVWSDNQSALKIMRSQVTHERTKHFDIRLHFLRNLVYEGMLEVEYISTKCQVADSLTKAVLKDKFEYCRLHFGVEEMMC
jgi:hypothetical protein